MSAVLVESLFILALIMTNGVFAMSELAVVSARKSRLKTRAERGDRKARRALELADDPNRFLSTVQVGITLVGTLAGAFGGATIAENIADGLKTVPSLAAHAEGIGLAIVVASITYLSLVLGELVPKRLAIANAEGIATRVAEPLHWLSIVGVPLVRVLSRSTDTVLWLLRIKPVTGPPTTEEEVKVLLKEGAAAGVIEPAEHDMVKRVFRLADRRAASLMTHASDVVWIDAADPPQEIQRKITSSPHSRFPVCDETLDSVLGIVHVKDLLIHGFTGKAFDIRGILKVPLFIYAGMPGLKMLETFKSSANTMAIVLSEYGSVVGILTVHDLLQAVVGDLPMDEEPTNLPATKRPDGSWLVDGLLSIEEFKDLLEIPELPDGDFQTVAGFVLSQLSRIPSVADTFEWGRIRVEVVDMDGNRVDKVLVVPIATPPDTDA
jgi:putative hemolysin